MQQPYTDRSESDFYLHKVCVKWYLGIRKEVTQGYDVIWGHKTCKTGAQNMCITTGHNADSSSTQWTQIEQTALHVNYD